MAFCSGRSSVLSHFFKQGANSARLFSTFEPAWEHLRDLVEARAGAEAAENLDAVRIDDASPSRSPTVQTASSSLAWFPWMCAKLI